MPRQPKHTPPGASRALYGRIRRLEARQADTPVYAFMDFWIWLRKQPGAVDELRPLCYAGTDSGEPFPTSNDLTDLAIWPKAWRPYAVCARQWEARWEAQRKGHRA